jgi:ABC-type amino acid transport system permease subunit
MTSLLALSPQFDPAQFWDALQPDANLLRALWTTVYVSVLAQVLGTALGVLSAIGGMSTNPVAHAERPVRVVFPWHACHRADLFLVFRLWAAHRL